MSWLAGCRLGDHEIEDVVHVDGIGAIQARIAPCSPKADVDA
jgi:hypothetical protein